MKQNYETCLVGQSVILFPYRPEHVPKYHEWMQDPRLLEATGSEPLSLEEEVQMQQSWRDDDNKCTFIVHRRKHTLEESSCGNSITTSQTSQQLLHQPELFVEDHLESMVGDVNLFLSDIDESEDENDEHGEEHKVLCKVIRTISPRHHQRQAEIDIMIAEPNARGQGLGREATCIMLLYGLQELNVKRFFCKINEDNHASIALFQNLGFVQCDYSSCFQQVELELKKTPNEMKECLVMHDGGKYMEVPCPLTANDFNT